MLEVAEGQAENGFELGQRLDQAGVVIGLEPAANRREGGESGVGLGVAVGLKLVEDDHQGRGGGNQSEQLIGSTLWDRIWLRGEQEGEQGSGDHVSWDSDREPRAGSETGSGTRGDTRGGGNQEVEGADGGTGEGADTLIEAAADGFNQMGRFERRRGG